jgi:DNA-binding NtrC family response regulator
MKKRILLIDDDKDELEIFTEALAAIDSDYECSYADNTNKAYDMIRRAKTDLIFVDYNMGPMNGLQFLSVVTSDDKFKAAKVYLYSTHISDEVNKMAKVLGAAGSIEKPFELQVLTHQLKAILNPDLLPPYVFFAR